MCGIVGIFDTRGRRDIDRDLLHRMNETQHHRGPDEGGLHTEPGVGLGHRRLSIIDLSSGQQPLYNEDETVVVVYNGEIYNFPDLTKELVAAGHTFRTHCDTEVIVHAWEEWGEDCVKRFRGMFAFGLWDRNRNRLFLARDRLGIKPLYYALLPDGHFIFGSELKALMRHPGLPRDIEPRAVEDYFALGYVPEPKTIFRHAMKLSPAHTLTMGVGGAAGEPRAYWDVSFAEKAIGSEQAVGEELIERLKDAVQVRLISEVPLGAFLSGGVDSSAVVALMAQVSAGEPVKTCSIGFDTAAFNETEFAAQVAARYKTDHYVEQVGTDDYDLIDALATLYDEPYADSSALPTYRVCELAKRKVTVALSGDGGDENLAGYRRYRWHMHEERLRGLFPAGLRRPLFGLLGAAYPKLDWAPRIFRAKSTFQALARDSLEGYYHNFTLLPDALRARMYSPAFRRDLDGYQAIEVFRHHMKSAPDHPLSMVQYLDLKTYLPGDILTKVDRASMAHALEVRVPILDHLFVDWVASLPPGLKLRGNEGKYVFKKALEPHLPRDILYRPKMGFAVPLAEWFRGPLRNRVQDSLLGAGLAETGYFDMDFVGWMVDRHQRGLRDFSAAIWSLLMFEAFYRRLAA